MIWDLKILKFNELWRFCKCVLCLSSLYFLILSLSYLFKNQKLYIYGSIFICIYFGRNNSLWWFQSYCFNWVVPISIIIWHYIYVVLFCPTLNQHSVHIKESTILASVHLNRRDGWWHGHFFCRFSVVRALRGTPRPITKLKCKVIHPTFAMNYMSKSMVFYVSLIIVYHLLNRRHKCTQFLYVKIAHCEYFGSVCVVSFVYAAITVLFYFKHF